MTTNCVFTDCQTFLSDVQNCNIQQGNLAVAKCLCSDTVIASYSQCQPCLYSQGQTTLIDGTAYAAACRSGGSGLTGYPTGYPTNYPTGRSTGGGGNGGGNNNSDSGSKTGMYIGIGCGVGALVILVAAFFIVRSRKNAKKNGKGDAAAAANPPQPPPPMQPVQQNQFPPGQAQPMQQVQQNQFQPQPQPQPQVQQFQPQTQAQYVQPDQQQQFQQQQFQQQQFQQQQFQQQQYQQPTYAQQPDQQYKVQQQQPIYAQPQDHVYQAQPHPGFVQPGGYYVDPQQQAYYPNVSSPPGVAQPTPSPKFSAADQYHGQQQYVAASAPMIQEGIASTGNYHLPPPTTSTQGYSPVSTSLTTATTVYDPSQSPDATKPKPTISPHGPQAIPEGVKQPSAPANPQYVEGGYH
ncbi:hypothetical protein B0O80DRAFT_446007 [Mortierella sp. GBAus27b]|nr:hypothetical protein BGX31_001061 [Mortierella sp. GBA43]KAI8356871.1 hypothetical protein B0O80DRAFT_446007 [Mortierella sp. GBAus27b]